VVRHGPLAASQVVGAIPLWSEPRLQGGRLFWLERRPEDGGRTRLLMRPAGPLDLPAIPTVSAPPGQEITPAGADVRSRIHAYGGGAYAVGGWPAETAAPLEAIEAGGSEAGAWEPLDAAPVGTPGNGAPGLGLPWTGPQPGKAEDLASGNRAVGPVAGPSEVTAGSAVAGPSGAPVGATVVVVWVDDGDRCLWRLDLPPLESGAAAAPTASQQPLADAQPRRLTEPDPKRCFADGLIDPARGRWIGVLESGEQEALVSVPLAGGEPQVLRQPADFCGYAVLSPSGSHLAWIEWQRPSMPWERSQLWLGRLTPEGSLEDCRLIAGTMAREGVAVSVFQPLWIPREGQPADLVVSCDRSGWWNLERLEAAEALGVGEEPAWQPLLPLQAEFGMPQWVYGMATTAWDGEALVAAACFEGRWRLGRLVVVAGGGAQDAGATAGAKGAAAGGQHRGEGSGATAGLDARSLDRQDLGTFALKRAGTSDGQEARLTALQGAGAAVGQNAGTTTEHDAGSSRGQEPVPTEGQEAMTPSGQTPSGQTTVPPGDLKSVQGGTQQCAWSATGLSWQPYDLRFDDLAAVVAERGRLVALAASPSDPAGLLELDTASGRWRHTPAAASPLSEVAISHPEPLWFEGHGGRPTQAWYYPPRGGSHPGAPLLVKGHSGPTGMARTGLNLVIQFWTSRGWGVVDVNYGGSTGFGRAYRERLDGQWGVVDGADCAAAAAALVAAGRADPLRIAIEGGSAAGFTVLAALCAGAVFRAGACRYAVADLEGMARHTHRFEARYLDGLVGPWPEAAATYRERSPLLHAERIRVPVIFFQGLEDGVVPPDQTERMALALGKRGIPVEVHLFPGEGHGFRDRAVQQRVLEATEAFFRRHLDLP
jgi:dienelactone hydrolase